MLTHITKTLSVFDFEEYADLHHPDIVCFILILKSMLTYITQALSVLISKSMLTYITHTLSIFDFEKYADLHHPDVVCF